MHHLSAAEAGRLVAAREPSPVELTRAFLDRIESLNPALDAFITVTGARAIAAGACRRPPLRARW